MRRKRVDCDRGSRGVHATHQSLCFDDTEDVVGPAVFRGGKAMAPKGTGATSFAKCNRGGRRGEDLIKDSPSPQETKRTVSFGCRPKRSQSRVVGEALSDGDPSKGSNVHCREEMGDHHRPKGGLLSPPRPPILSKIFGNKGTRRPHLSLPHVKFRPIPGPLDLHQGYSPGIDHIARKGHHMLRLPRRLYCGGGQFRRSPTNPRRGGPSSLLLSRPFNKRGKEQTHSLSEGRVSGVGDGFGGGSHIHSNPKSKIIQEGNWADRSGLLEGETFSHTPQDRQHLRHHCSPRSCFASSKALYAFGARPHKGGQGIGQAMGPINGAYLGGHEGPLISKGGYKGERGETNENVSTLRGPIRGRKQERVGRSPSGCRYGLRTLGGTGTKLAYQCARASRGSARIKIIRLGRSGKGGPLNNRQHGLLLLSSERRRQELPNEQHRQGNYAARDKLGRKTSGSRVDSHRPQPRGRPVPIGRCGRLEGIRALLPNSDIPLVGRGNGGRGPLRRLIQYKIGALQQFDALSRLGRSGRILTKVGNWRGYELARSSLPSHSQNPFISTGGGSRRNNYCSKLGGAAVVAPSDGPNSRASGQVNSRRHKGGSQWGSGALLQQVLGHTRMPDNWEELSPREARLTAVMKEGVEVEVQEELSLSDVEEWARNRGLNNFSSVTRLFIRYCQDRELLPDDKKGSKRAVKSFLSNNEFAGDLAAYLRFAYSFAKLKLWDFNPAKALKTKGGSLSKDYPSTGHTINELIEVGRSKETVKAYGREWKDYTKFCAFHNLDFKEVDALGAYLVELWKEGSTSKALSAINAVKKGALLLGWDSSPTEALIIKEARDALRRIKSTSTAEFKREPLPAKAVVTFVLGVVSEGLGGVPYYQRCCAILLIGFRLMLRAKSLGAIRVRDLTFKEWGMEVALSPIKTMSSWQRKHIEHSDDSRLCPVQWTKEYILEAGLEPEDLLFGDANGLPLTSMTLTSLVRKVASYAGLEGDFSGHSLRIGGATAAALGGVTISHIQAVGGWDSFAVLRYIRSVVGVKTKMSEMMGLVVGEELPPNSYLSL